MYATPLHAPHHEAAIEVLKRQIGANPKHPLNHYQLGAVHLDKGEVESAIANFKDCLERDPKFQQASEKLHLAYQKSGQREEAMNLLQKMLNQEASPEGYNTAGVMYYQSQETDKAINAFKKTLEIDPRYQPANNNLYQLYREQGVATSEAETYPEAVSFFLQALDFNPTNATLYNLIGDTYTRSRDTINAIAQYKKTLPLNTGDTETPQNLARTYNNLGVQLTKAQHWEQAIEAYHQALQLMSELAGLKTNLEDLY